MALSRSNFNMLLRTVIVFIVYLFYTKIIVSFFNLIGIDNSISPMFIADLLFLFGIIIVYKDTIEKGFKNFKTDYKILKKITTIVKWVVLIFFVTILWGFITEIFFPEIASLVDDNVNAIDNLFSISFIYTIFKTLIFAVVAEELVFKKAIRDVFNNNLLFIVVSGLIYMVMNIAYADLSSSYIWLDMFGYLIFAVISSIAYIKNNDNIFIVMLIKFVYNLIPLTILVLGSGA